MYDTGARIPRRLWYPVWETTSRPSPSPSSSPVDNSNFPWIFAGSPSENIESSREVVVTGCRTCSFDNDSSLLSLPFSLWPLHENPSRCLKKSSSPSASSGLLVSLSHANPRGATFSLSKRLPPWDREFDRSKAVFSGFFRDFVCRGYWIAPSSLSLQSWYSVTTRSVVTRPGLRSRPPRAREPNRRLAATSAAWRTSGLRICWWTAPALPAAAGRTSPGNFHSYQKPVSFEGLSVVCPLTEMPPNRIRVLRKRINQGKKIIGITVSKLNRWPSRLLSSKEQF